jgi:thiamine-phosphate pyrophosphorylase
LSKDIKFKGLARIVDANINRTKEGLRVCEEVTRFILNSRSQTAALKKIRHEVDVACRGIVSKEILLEDRASLKDVGLNIYANELKRRNIRDVFFANIQRVKESIRVLEEFSKLVNVNSALKFKRARYKVYEIEKKTAKAISLISAH